MINLRESQAILITGIIGSGKSLLLRSQISYIIRKSDNSFLNNMSQILFISNQSPITHTVPMNGFRDGMRKMFRELENQELDDLEDSLYIPPIPPPLPPPQFYPNPYPTIIPPPEI